MENITSTVTLAAAIIGATAAIKHLMPDDAVSGFVTIVVAVSLGVIAGLAHLDGLTPLTGILAAFVALGAVTWADRSAGTGK